jgi:hypothetical protein
MRMSDKNKLDPYVVACSFMEKILEDNIGIGREAMGDKRFMRFQMYQKILRDHNHYGYNYYE